MSAWDGLDDLDPFATKNSFDTSAYNGKKSTIKLMSVDWDKDYNHTVDWISEEERDAWFENHPSVEIDTGWDLDTGGATDKLLLAEPHTAARTFNYVVVTMYSQPVSSKSDYRKLKYFYFVTGVNRINPSTTEVILAIDTWTTYSTSASITGLKLQRGHYPHALTSADDYLANPLENHFGITDTEPDLPSIKPLVSYEHLVSFQKEDPRVCIATTADLSDKKSLWLYILDELHIGREMIVTMPDMSDLPEDYWWQRLPLEETDRMSMGLYGSAATPPVGSPTNNGNVPSALRVYSMETNKFNNFIDFLRRKFPQVLKTIQAVFVLDSTLIQESTSVDFYGHSLKAVTQQNSPQLLETIGLSKSLFNYDEKYEDFAKLYNNQFGIVEVSDLSGKKVEISIEDISESLEVYARSCSAFPFLKLEAFINGVGGKEKTTYAVKPWNSTNANLFMSSWEDFKFELDIPIYGIFVESIENNSAKAQAELWNNLQKAYTENEISTNNYNLDKSISQDALERDNDNRTDSIANDLSNELASIARNLTNSTEHISTTKENAYTSSNYQLENATDLITAAQLISNASAFTDYTNTNRMSLNALSMTMNTIDNAKTVSLASIDTQFTNTRNTAFQTYEVNEYELAGQERVYYVTQNIAAFSAQLNIYSNIKSAALGIASGMANSMISSISSASNPTVALSGAVGGLIAGVTTAWHSEILTEVAVMQTNLHNSSSHLDIVMPDPAFSYNYHGDSYGRAMIDYSQDIGTYANTNNLSTTVDNATLSKDTDISNTNLTWTTSFNNAHALRTAVADNNQDLYVTHVDNNQLRATTDSLVATNTYNNSINIINKKALTDQGIANRDSIVDRDIASNNADTNSSNLTRSYIVDSEIIKDKYDNRVDNTAMTYGSESGSALVEYLEDAIGAPTIYGKNDGNAWSDSWGQRGLDIRVRRCSKSIEKIAGDMFYRYGYHTNGIWIESPELTQMEKFTFWKAEEVWLDATNMDETNKEILRTIFKRGTTVWAKPEDMLKIDITTNKRRS